MGHRPMNDCPFSRFNQASHREMYSQRLSPERLQMFQHQPQPRGSTLYPQVVSSHNFKVKVINNGDIRLWRHSDLLDVHALYNFIATQWEVESLIAQYKDNDNDLVTLVSSEDMQEALELLQQKTQTTLRIFVRELPRNLFTELYDQVQELGNVVTSLCSNTGDCNQQRSRTQSSVNPVYSANFQDTIVPSKDPGESSQPPPDLNPMMSQSESIPNAQIVQNPVQRQESNGSTGRTREDVSSNDNANANGNEQESKNPNPNLQAENASVVEVSPGVGVGVEEPPGVPCPGTRVSSVPDQLSAINFLELGRMLSPVAECVQSRGASVGNEWVVKQYYERWGEGFIKRKLRAAKKRHQKVLQRKGTRSDSVFGCSDKFLLD